MLVDFYIGDEGIDKPGYATKVMFTWLVRSGQFCKDNYTVNPLCMITSR